MFFGKDMGSGLNASCTKKKNAYSTHCWAENLLVTLYNYRLVTIFLQNSKSAGSENK
jgi:hypothetical protein